MEEIKKYFDNVNEIDKEEVQEEIWKSCGNELGFFFPFNWGISPTNRYKTLLKILILALGGGILVPLQIITLYKALDFDITYAFTVLITLNYMGYMLVYLLSNLMNRPSFCNIFHLIMTGFIEYGDFPHGREKAIRRVASDLCYKYRRIILRCFIIFPVVLVSIIIDNNLRDPETLPDWFDTRMPQPVWLPIETSSSIPCIFIVLVELWGVVVFASCVYGNVLCLLKVSVTMRYEVQLLTEAVQLIEKRAVRCYVKFMRSAGRSVDASSLNIIKLFKDENFNDIYMGCLKKIIKHHQIILEVMESLNEVFATTVLYSEYTSGVSVALLIYMILDETNAIHFRIFSMVPMSVLYGVIASICTVCQKVKDDMIALHDEIYMIQWIYANENFKQSLRIFQIRTLKVEGIRSKLSGDTVDLAFLVTVTKACYSMINFILIMRE